MALEQAFSEIIRKPWGRNDLRPWNPSHDNRGAIGEIWFQRAEAVARGPALLLKLLFTTERLSIQVHPDDAYARSIGLNNGKTEAWYVLEAEAGGEIAVGLNRTLTKAELRLAIEDGSIAGLVAWRTVRRDETISVPAGTIHAIGAGLVVAEIQQRSDTTFRMFDYGRGRDLQVDDAVAVAQAGPAAVTAPVHEIDPIRTVLVANAWFVFERIELPPDSHWMIHADCETWILVLGGHGRLGSLNAFLGQAFFLEAVEVRFDVGHVGLSALVAYDCAIPRPRFLSRLLEPLARFRLRPRRRTFYPRLRHIRLRLRKASH